jgi:hypothetical protein
MDKEKVKIFTLESLTHNVNYVYERYKEIQPDIKFATYGQAINSKFEDLIVNLKALIKVEMNEEQNEPDITRLFHDIWSYLNSLDETSEKYQYAFGLAKEMYDKGLNPNDHVKEIIIDVENLYKNDSNIK